MTITSNTPLQPHTPFAPPAPETASRPRSHSTPASIAAQHPNQPQTHPNQPQTHADQPQTGAQSSSVSTGAPVWHADQPQGHQAAKPTSLQRKLTNTASAQNAKRARREVIAKRRQAILIHIDDTMAAGGSEFNGVKMEDNRPIQDRQDSAMIRRITAASAWPLPKNIKKGEFVVVPRDEMPCEFSDGVEGSTMLEFNGSGYGNFTTMEKESMADMLIGYSMIGERLLDPSDDMYDPNGLIIITNSGREDPPKFAHSKKTHEKDLIKNAVVQPFREAGIKAQGLFVDAFDENAENRVNMDQMRETLQAAGWDNPTGPTIINGYTAQMAQAIESRNGVPYLFGRRVRAFLNDRGILNVDALNKKNGEKLDPDTFIACNRTYVPAADKGVAYAYHNDFSRTEAAKEFPEFTRPTLNIQCHTPDEYEQESYKLLDQGKHIIGKPSGTGHGDGILPMFTFERQHELGEEVPEELLAKIGGWGSIREQIEKSLKKVKDTYGDRGGFPITLSEFVFASRINKPGDPGFHTAKYEFRIAMYVDWKDPDEPMIVAYPSIIKIDAGSILKEGEDGRFSKELASVSTQVLKTGRPASDFMQPVCNAETMAMIGKDEAYFMRMCQAATRMAALTLANVDKRTEVGAVD